LTYSGDHVQELLILESFSEQDNIVAVINLPAALSPDVEFLKVNTEQVDGEDTFSTPQVELSNAGLSQGETPDSVPSEVIQASGAQTVAAGDGGILTSLSPDVALNLLADVGVTQEDFPRLFGYAPGSETEKADPSDLEDGINSNSTLAEALDQALFYAEAAGTETDYVYPEVPHSKGVLNDAFIQEPPPQPNGFFAYVLNRFRFCWHNIRRAFTRQPSIIA
jgi:hypothetical protein